MKNFIETILLALLLLSVISSCQKDPVKPAPIDESAIQKTSSSEFGEINTNSGISIRIIPGVVPPNDNGNEGTVSFSIETPITPPVQMRDKSEFVGQVVKFGPENFYFSWPLELTLPYGDYSNPEQLSVVFYDLSNEEWVIIPKTGIDISKKTVSFSSIQLGLFSLAYFSPDYREGPVDGGFEFTANPSYFYTLTVKQATNYKFPDQLKWPGNPPTGVTGSSGVRNNTPVTPCTITLPQADYQIWISRTKPGTSTTLPFTETYTIPAVGSLVDKPLDYLAGKGWQKLFLPNGGSWQSGPPEYWPTPTVTYGTGDFQATLTWVNNSNHTNDIDLHLYGPGGIHVYWDFPISLDETLKLDRDWTEETLGYAVENIYSYNTLIKGDYEVTVKLYKGSSASFNIRIINNGVVKSYNRKIESQDGVISIYKFTK